VNLLIEGHAGDWKKEIYKYIEMINDTELSNAVRDYITHYEGKFFAIPGSTRYHHVYTGGTLKHTLEVCEIGLRIIDSCELDVNKDYYIASAVLHDVGKKDDYEFDSYKRQWIHARNKKVRIDHSVFPIVDFAEVTGYILPKEIQLAIMSHMGGWSSTSVYPDDLLSSVLHSADLISSRLER